MDASRKSCCRRAWMQWPITCRFWLKPAAPSRRQQVLRLRMSLCRPNCPLRVSGHGWPSTRRGQCCECLAWIPSVTPTFWFLSKNGCQRDLFMMSFCSSLSRTKREDYDGKMPTADLDPAPKPHLTSAHSKLTPNLTTSLLMLCSDCMWACWVTNLRPQE